MSLLSYASALLALIASPTAPPRINLDAKSGDVISGEHTFRVTVDSTPAINQVEFYVNNDLRDTETATPYLFTFDTLDEKDGDLTLKFKAYTVENQSTEKSITIHINNELDKGAPYHVQKGMAALTDSKWQDALDQGRVALKIDSQNNDARLVLARANLGLKSYDKAQKYAEDAIAQDPKNDPALQLLSAIEVREAFATYAKEGSDRGDVLNTIADDFKNAVQNRRKSLDLAVDQAGAPSGGNLVHFADVAIRAERYSLVISALEGPFAQDPKQIALGDRLAFAQLRSGRLREATQVLLLAKNTGSLDAYGQALLSLIYLQLDDDKNADDSMKDALLSDPDNLGVQTVQAFTALKRNRTNALSKLSADLSRDQGHRADVDYFLMALADRQQRFGDARRYFQQAVLTEPANPDVYIEQANNSIALAQDPRLSAAEKGQNYAEARMYYQTAIYARPEAVDALAGLAVVALLEKKTDEAVKFAEAARDAAPEEGAGHFAAAAAYQAAGRSEDAQRENNRAGQLDKANLEGREIPNALAVWRYLTTGGRRPVVSAP